MSADREVGLTLEDEGRTLVLTPDQADRLVRAGLIHRTDDDPRFHPTPTTCWAKVVTELAAD